MQRCLHGRNSALGKKWLEESLADLAEVAAELAGLAGWLAGWLVGWLAGLRGGLACQPAGRRERIWRAQGAENIVFIA